MEHVDRLIVVSLALADTSKTLIEELASYKAKLAPEALRETHALSCEVVRMRSAAEEAARLLDGLIGQTPGGESRARSVGTPPTSQSFVATSRAAADAAASFSRELLLVGEQWLGLDPSYRDGLQSLMLKAEEMAARQIEVGQMLEAMQDERFGG